jgi:hypothetical protein
LAAVGFPFGPTIRKKLDFEDVFPVPRDAITLADVREPTIEVVCEPRGRRGRYNVERLIAKHGADNQRGRLRARALRG